MQIDWSAFTPWASLAGGALIGLSAALLVLLNGRVLTVRRDDLRAIACILDVTPDLAVDRLEGLGVMFATPTPSTGT